MCGALFLATDDDVMIDHVASPLIPPPLPLVGKLASWVSHLQHVCPCLSEILFSSR